MKCKKRDDAKTIEEVILRNTGYTDIDLFLNGSKSEYNIKYLDDAAKMIKSAIVKHQKITIVGDYDADGITSSSIMKYTIDFLGGDCTVRIPRRFSEGYGISEKIIDEIDSGLVITVDNGIVAFDAIQKAKEKGLDVILTDHHLLDESGKVPNADIVIDPHIEGTADFADYCGAGIAYKLCEKLTSDSIVLDKLSCFAALGTIADVMPLIEDNRKIVQKGLKNMTTYGHRTSGLYAFLANCNYDKEINEENIGFMIGPCINAAGRLYDDGAKYPLEVLLYDGPFDGTKGQDLIAINDKRKKMVSDGISAIELNIQENCLYGDYPLVIYEPGLNEGIVGILAGKIAEQMQVPTFVFTDSEDPDIYKGSARSYSDFHLKDLLDKANSSDNSIFARYGGHASAAGVSVYKEKYYDMINIFQEMSERASDVDDTIYYDLEVSVDQIHDTIQELKKYAPYGEGNKQIIFKVNDFVLSPHMSNYYKLQGDNEQHVKLYGIGVTASAFDMSKKYFDMKEPKRLNLVGTIAENKFMYSSEDNIKVIDMESAEIKHKRTALEERLAKRAKNRYAK